MKRYLILVACAVMMACLGTNQAWSVFIRPLRTDYGFSAFQMQCIFTTSSLVFAIMVMVGGHLYDRFGPRPLAAVSAILVASGWLLAWAFGENYWCLWAGLGVILGCGNSLGYLCPIATAIKWFPKRRGLASGVVVACFGGGPVVLSAIAETFLKRGWNPLSIFGIVAAVYAPLLFLTGMMLAHPPKKAVHGEVSNFKRSSLPRDGRFWTLFVGMFVGTLPYLLVMGNAKPLAVDFGLSASLAAIAISVMAAANAMGRVFWGAVVDRIGPRSAMMAAQSLAVASLILLVAAGSHWSGAFLISIFGVGFCYGSNFVIYPATVTGLYGVHVLGSVYPFVMAAQGIATFGTAVNGLLKDHTGSNYPGLFMALFVAFVGGAICLVLSRSLSGHRY